MTLSIYVDHYGELDSGQRERLDAKFTEIHGQDHGFAFVAERTLDEFIAIPCHWDSEHAIQTARDITEVMIRCGYDKFRITNSY